MKDFPADSKKSYWLIEWVKQPSSWLSLTAALISILTFYLVYEKKGEVQVIMPDKVGVSMLHGDALLLIPLTFTNTGAPRSVNYVTRVTASLSNIDPHELPVQQVDFHWRFELTTIGKLQYFQKYPDKQKEEATKGLTTDDYVDYVGRTFPFALYGGASVSKLFNFVHEGGFQPSLHSFELAVRAETGSGIVSSKVVKYICSGRQLGESYDYCLQP